MFSYSPDRYMLIVLRLIKGILYVVYWKGIQLRQTNPNHVCRHVCVCVHKPVFLLRYLFAFEPVFLHKRFKFGQIAMWNVEGELDFRYKWDLRVWKMPNASESFLCLKSPLPNGQGARNHDKNPFHSWVFMSNLSIVNKWVGLDGSVLQCFGFQSAWGPGLHSSCSLDSPWTKWEVWVNKIRPLVCRHWSHMQPPVTSFAFRKH